MATIKKLEGEVDLWLKQEDVKWKQRAKRAWYKVGDKTTKFFHTSATQRCKHNKIQSIKNHQGVVVSSQVKIEDVFRDYFQ